MLRHQNMKRVLSICLCCMMLLGAFSFHTLAAEGKIVHLFSAQDGTVQGTAQKTNDGVAVTRPETEGTVTFAAVYNEDGQMVGITSLAEGASTIACDPEAAEVVRFFEVDGTDYTPVSAAQSLDLTASNPTDTIEDVHYTSTLLSFYPSYCDYIALAFYYLDGSAQWQTFQIDRVQVNGLACDIEFMDRQALIEELTMAGITLEEAGCETAFAAAYINFDYDAAVAAATEHEVIYEDYECAVLAFTFEVSGIGPDGKLYTETFTIRYLDDGYGGYL